MRDASSAARESGHRDYGHDEHELLPAEGAKSAALMVGTATIAKAIQPIASEIGAAYRAHCEAKTIEVKANAEVVQSAHRRDERIVSLQEQGATDRCQIDVLGASLKEAVIRGDKEAAEALRDDLRRIAAGEVSAGDSL